MRKYRFLLLQEWQKENGNYIKKILIILVLRDAKKEFNNNLAKYVGKEEKRQPPMQGCC
ncbi:MAG: hypothetical protein WBC45_04700 [Atribacterota bacterium]